MRHSRASYPLFLARHSERTLANCLVVGCREKQLKNAQAYADSINHVYQYLADHVRHYNIVGVFDGPGFMFLSRLAAQRVAPMVLFIIAVSQLTNVDNRFWTTWSFLSTLCISL